MQDFPSNSNKEKNRYINPAPGDKSENIEPVTSGETVRRRKGLGAQFKNTFIGGNARDAFEYMTTDVVIPTVRDLISEALHAVTDRLIYGDTRPRRGPKPRGYDDIGRVNYREMSQPQRQQSSPRTLPLRDRSTHSFNDIIIPSRQEAEEVIDRMFDILSRDGSVPLSTLYALTNIQISHTDYKWGWTELRGARASTRTRSGGYLLELPPPELLA